MLKKTLLSLAIATTAMTLVACNDKETVVTPADTDTVVVEPAVVETETMPETEVMPETDPMAETDPMGETAATQSIAEIAAGNENLTILTAALQEAGLDTMMMDAGEYTVFAPTDNAFSALLSKLNVTKEELLADKDMLKSVLTYHVVPMIVKAVDIPYDTDIKTANGQNFSISSDNVITDASGNKANITGTDMMATNGVVHVIDTVLLPK